MLVLIIDADVLFYIKGENCGSVAYRGDLILRPAFNFEGELCSGTIDNVNKYVFFVYDTWHSVLVTFPWIINDGRFIDSIKVCFKTQSKRIIRQSR